MNFLFGLAKPFLMGLDPEKAHGATIAALRLMPTRAPLVDDQRLAVDAFGLRFPNPVGMAAGFDKHGEAADALLGMGFGFTEVGTITPRPQPGNPKPRLFRLADDLGVINRFGFNSEGHAAVHKRLAARKPAGVVGVNVGANKDAGDRAADYVAGINAFADVASYFTINISSPNTPGLRDLQQAAALDDLLGRVLEARDAATERHGRKPILLKIAPDLTEGDLDDIVRVSRARGIDGMIVSNTTIERPSTLRSPQAREAGGLSGKPLFPLATKVLAQSWLRVEKQFPIVGAGGIDSAETAFAKIEAGASLVQLYSAMVYLGPALVTDIKRGLPALLAKGGYGRVADAVGVRAADWASGKVSATRFG